MNWTCARREHDLALLRMFVRFHARCGRLHSSDSKISRGLGHVLPLKHLIAGSLEVKLPTYGQMQQQLCEQSEKRKSQWKEDQKRERVREEKQSSEERRSKYAKRWKSRETLFFHNCSNFSQLFETLTSPI